MEFDGSGCADVDGCEGTIMGGAARGACARNRLVMSGGGWLRSGAGARPFTCENAPRLPVGGMPGGMLGGIFADRG